MVQTRRPTVSIPYFFKVKTAFTRNVPLYAYHPLLADGTVDGVKDGCEEGQIAGGGGGHEGRPHAVLEGHAGGEDGIGGGLDGAGQALPQLPRDISAQRRERESGRERERGFEASDVPKIATTCNAHVGEGGMRAGVRKNCGRGNTYTGSLARGRVPRTAGGTINHRYTTSWDEKWLVSASLAKGTGMNSAPPPLSQVLTIRGRETQKKKTLPPPAPSTKRPDRPLRRALHSSRSRHHTTA